MRLRFAPRILAVCLLFYASHPHGQWQPDGVPIWKRLTSLAVLVVYLMSMGCSAMHDIPVSKANSATDTIFAVIYPSGEVVEFNEKGGAIDSYSKTINGTTKAGATVSIPVADVQFVRVMQNHDTTKTVLVTAGIVAGVALAAGIVFWFAFADHNNCPFVYAFDGKDYIFDAQPLGGAFARGLERSDLSRLEHLRPVNGTYRVLIRNEERNETQYLDEAQLIVADHPTGTRVVPDSTGSLHVIGDVVTASKVTDESGTDIHRFFGAPDEVAWQTKMPDDDSWRGLPPRHELTFEFQRPRDASSADLVVKAGNAPWGSEMIHRMLALHGNNIEPWQESMDSNGAAFEEWAAFNAREELYSLRLNVFASGRWVTRARIPGGASLATEERVIHVDLEGVSGEIVKIRVCPPRGFWALDFLGLGFERQSSPEVTVVPLKKANTGDGVDVTPLLSTVDDRRHVMPRVGDEVALEFAAPAAPGNGSRTVFFDLRGYYHARIDKSQPEQKQLLDQLAHNNGRIIEYSMELYMKWRTDLLSQR